MYGDSKWGLLIEDFSERYSKGNVLGWGFLHEDSEGFYVWGF